MHLEHVRWRKVYCKLNWHRKLAIVIENRIIASCIQNKERKEGQAFGGFLFNCKCSPPLRQMKRRISRWRWTLCDSKAVQCNFFRPIHKLPNHYVKRKKEREIKVAMPAFAIGTQLVQLNASGKVSITLQEKGVHEHKQKKCTGTTLLYYSSVVRQESVMQHWECTSGHCTTAVLA